MLFAGLFLTSNDAITKWLVPHYPPGEILFLQAILIALLVAMWMRFKREPLFRFNNWRPHLYRGLLYVVGSFAFVYALQYLPLAEVVAIAFAGPLFMTLFARILLKESVGPHRLFAVVIGFVGVMIVIRPGSAAMHWAVFLPIIVALSDAFRDIVTRTMTVGESSKRIVLSTAIILALAAASTSFGGWNPVRHGDLIWYGLSAGCFVIAHFFMIEAFRHAQIGVIAPFKYVQLIWSILAGLIFWGEIPDPIVFLGIVVISSAGVYIGWRETIISRRKKLNLEAEVPVSE
jgi:drug/metabolite transporter (DMT)-like permease